MDPNTVALVVFAEQMAALAAQTVAQLKAVIQGSATQTTEEILADADATYQSIIDNRAQPIGIPVPPIIK